MLRLGVDTGGTFTDFILLDSQRGRWFTHKVLSTPEAPEKAILSGIQALMEKVEQAWIDEVVHGSTVATNALLEGKGARTAFVTTSGFEDTLWIARQDRPDIYALEVARPAPPVPRTLCLGVNERINAQGEVLIPLADNEIDRLIKQLQMLDVEAVVVSLLHSYANPSHERLLAHAIRQHLSGVHLTLSSDLLPEFREYERGATCVVNGIIAPIMIAYLSRLEETLGSASLRIMVSSGGTMSPTYVKERPVQTILSGPAGGTLGALKMAQQAGVERVITLDMGGTSTDVALLEGMIPFSMETEIAHLPVRVPMVDIHTVGAGGGSIAWIDTGGALRVGPQSVGADPGPACYGRQHFPFQPTVTDAHVVLGHLQADRLLGGKIKPDVEAARKAVMQIANKLGMKLEETAEGILRVAEATMARAVQRVSVQRGHDPRRYVLMPFGGAGAMHACRLAEYLGMHRVLVPVYPGLLSALGMLHAAPLHTFSQTIMKRLLSRGENQYPDPMMCSEVEEVVQALQAMGSERLSREGVPIADHQIEVFFDIRYLGQSYEITVPALKAVSHFLRRHHQLYGYVAPDHPLEVVNIRVHAKGREYNALLPSWEKREEAKGASMVQVYEKGNWQFWHALERASLQPGDSIPEQSIIWEFSATTVVPSGWTGSVDTWGLLHLKRKDTGA